MADNTPLKKNRKLRLVARAAGITCVALLISMIIANPFTASVSNFFSTNDPKDFEISDLYVQIADRRPVRSYDNRIVVVDIDRSDREEIADVLKSISECDPEVVAIDINFELPKVDDSNLIDALTSQKSLVLPLGLGEKDGKFDITDRPFFYDTLPGVKYGAVNFPTKGNKNGVRDFSTYFPMSGGEMLPSFPVAIAELVDPEAVKQIRKKGEATGVIAYASREIPVIPQEEIMEHTSELAGNIVMVGALNDADDIYQTPLRWGESGVMIHAFALSTILDHKEIYRLPSYTDNIIAVVVCFIIIFLSISLTTRFKGVIMRCTQLLFAFLAVRIGYGMYVDHDIICSFTYTLLMIAFGLFAIDIWNGGEYLGEIIIRKIKKIKSKEDFI